MSLVNVKRTAAEMLKKHPSLVKELNDEPDRLPRSPAAFTTLKTYWKLVFAAWEEEREEA